MVRINLASLLSSPAFISSFHQTGSWESGKMDSSIDGLRLSTVNTDVQVLVPSSGWFSLSGQDERRRSGSSEVWRVWNHHASRA